MFTKLICAALLATAVLATPLLRDRLQLDDDLNRALAVGGLESRLHPDVGLTVMELIEKAGYKGESHGNLVTEDGYILEMHRIPHGRNNQNQTGKGPVLLMHGLTTSSADWVMLGKDNALAYILADQGYDVWMGNARGNRWSRKHLTYDADVDKKEFWDFSWNEVGLHDLPVMIDHVLKVNGAEKLFYIGHSQGTTAFFVLMSEKPEYNSKIRLMSAFAPVAYLYHAFCPICQLLSQFEQDVEWLSEKIGMYEFLPDSEVFDILGRELCHETSPIAEVCSSILFLLCGFDSAQLNQTLVPLVLSNVPSGSSTKQFLHYSQEIKSGYFRKYDYHLEDLNVAKYGQVSPPEYNIKNIVAPIALHYGQNDWLTAVKDVHKLRDELPNVVLDNLIEYKLFNHLDFLWATDVVEFLYNDAIAEMAKY